MPEAEENCQEFKTILFLISHGIKTAVKTKKISADILKGCQSECLNSKMNAKNA